jgi:trans-aconitate methyltransferase
MKIITIFLIVCSISFSCQAMEQQNSLYMLEKQGKIKIIQDKVEKEERDYYLELGQNILEKNNIALEKFSNILHFGCYHGNLTAFLAEKAPKAKVVGVGFLSSMGASGKAMYFYRDAMPNLSFDSIDEKNFPTTYEGKFDLVLSFAALHWMEDHATVLKNISKCLQPGGQVLIHTTDDSYDIHPGLMEALVKLGTTEKWKNFVGTFDITNLLKITIPDFKPLDTKRIPELLENADLIPINIENNYEITKKFEDIDQVLAWLKPLTDAVHMVNLFRPIVDAKDFIKDLVIEYNRSLPQGEHEKLVFPIASTTIILAQKKS